MKIAIADIGYVSSSMSVSSPSQHKLVAPGIELAKVALINQQKNPVCDANLHVDLAHKPPIIIKSTFPEDFEDNARKLYSTSISVLIEYIWAWCSAGLSRSIGKTVTRMASYLQVHGRDFLYSRMPTLLSPSSVHALELNIYK